VDLGYSENYYWDNIKLLLMVVACAFAMVAQFYPMPFPQSRPLLGVCCIRCAHFHIGRRIAPASLFVFLFCLKLTEHPF
jgi:hypothetical protein